LHAEIPTRAGTLGEVFLVFLKLGLTSFGGPIAHLGYFRDELVVRRQWLSEAAYGELVALCQFLPGPASSQVGFALGLRRAGPLGALAAWAAFTLPSAILLLIFAASTAAFGGALAQGVLHGLKLVAVAIVAQAVWGMAKNLTPDRTRAAIALAALFVVVIWGGAAGQVGAILLGAAAGLAWCRKTAQVQSGALEFAPNARTGLVALVLLGGLLIILPVLATASPSHAIDLFDAFYRAGSLVFGGGHVVLPLLQSEVVAPGWVSQDEFIAGYGATQAVPGPLFTFAAYLGAVGGLSPNGIAGAALALVAIFLPGMLVLVGALPFWDALRRRSWAQAGMQGANAAVVGILASALYNPIWTSAVLTPLDFTLVSAGFLALVVWKAPPWIVVVALAVAAACLGAFG
jgi:chromate transporter